MKRNVLYPIKDELRYKRIEYLIKMLLKSNKKFDCPLKAHKHVSECLRKVEDMYAPSRKTTMHICEIGLLNLNKISQIYCLKMNQHTLLIHENGAYAIYRSDIIVRIHSAFNWKQYRENSVCLVQIKNSEGKSLWENEYNLALH